MKYTLRDFYSEEGKSLKMKYSYYSNGCCRYATKVICRTAFWSLHKRLHRINGWHKLDVIHKRIGKGYSCSRLGEAELPLHKLRVICEYGSAQIPPITE